ncbi:MAG: ATP-binding protein [Ilumatobacter sp.]|uniref:ATP-binding protein n=1 Tax=Ilumatobacter sp. TaxID=1967498 RepID=UPI0032974A88
MDEVVHERQGSPILRIEGESDGWLALVREAIRDVIGVDIDADASSAFLTAVTEIATNAEAAGVRAGATRPVVVAVDADRRSVEVSDFGGGFDPEQHRGLPDPSVTSGRGLHIARTFCPGLTWTRTATGMTCTLPFPEPI